MRIHPMTLRRGRPAAGLALAFALVGCVPTSGAPPASSPVDPRVAPPSDKGARVARDDDRFTPPVPTVAPRPTDGADPTSGLPASTPEPWPTGIVEEAESVLPRAIAVSNRWVARRGRGYLVVYAGADPANESKGLVLALRFSALGEPEGAPIVVAWPDGSGPLRIVATAGDRLTIRSRSGRERTFDARAGRFL